MNRFVNLKTHILNSHINIPGKMYVKINFNTFVVFVYFCFIILFYFPPR